MSTKEDYDKTTTDRGVSTSCSGRSVESSQSTGSKYFTRIMAGDDGDHSVVFASKMSLLTAHEPILKTWSRDLEGTNTRKVDFGTRETAKVDSSCEWSTKWGQRVVVRAYVRSLSTTTRVEGQKEKGEGCHNTQKETKRDRKVREKRLKNINIHRG